MGKPRWSVETGDCVDVMRTHDADSVDSVVTDPPYGLAYVDHDWAEMTGWEFCAFCETWGKVALRVLKPGGHLLAFGSARTVHWLAAGLELAGFEVRDQLGWLHGGGVPNSRPMHAPWIGWGTALKPAWDPILLARKPLSEATVADNLARWGTGALNISACRVGAVGRWPANLLHDGSDDVVDSLPPNVPRMFFCGKATALDREEGLEQARAQVVPLHRPTLRVSVTKGLKNFHPSVKPTALMRHLVRLVTQPGGLVLDPMCGSGSTGKAAILEGLTFAGIDINEAYTTLASDRLAAAVRQVSPERQRERA